MLEGGTRHLEWRLVESICMEEVESTRLLYVPTERRRTRFCFPTEDE
jgi:hypothetical protein